MAIKFTKQAPKTYSSDCSRCGCAFTYQLEDVHHNYTFGGEQVSCPGCGHGVRHNGSPGAWRER